MKFEMAIEQIPPHKLPTLDDLTGLTNAQLARALVENPRSYMNVRGASAEEHLRDILEQLCISESISSYERAGADSDKDFKIYIPGEHPLKIECKNVEAITLNQDELADYFYFLVSQQYITEDDLFVVIHDKSPDLVASTSGQAGCNSIAELRNVIRQHGNAGKAKDVLRSLPRWIQHSSYPLYHFSAWDAADETLADVEVDYFLEQFGLTTPSIDFQRSRNSLEESEDSMRPYSIDEIDILAACFFSRTLRWEFLYAHDLPLHDTQEGYYSENVIIEPRTGKWFKSLDSCISNLLQS